MAKAIDLLGKDKAENRQMYLGHQGHVLTFGVGRGTLLNVVAFHTAKNRDAWEGDWIQPLQKDSLDSDFVGWGDKVTKLMEVRYLFLRCLARTDFRTAYSSTRCLGHFRSSRSYYIPQGFSLSPRRRRSRNKSTLWTGRRNGG